MAGQRQEGRASPVGHGRSLNSDHSYEHDKGEGGFRKCWPRKKVATVGNRLDVGREKDSGETEISLGFPLGGP